MTAELSNNKLYQIINRALAKWCEFDDIPADIEIKIFEQKYNHRCQNNPQLNIFEDQVPIPDEVKKAKQFCMDIENYRARIDSPYTYELPLSFYRRLYESLKLYEPHILPKNQCVYETLLENMQSNLPECRNEIILKHYNKEISFIRLMKRNKNIEYVTRIKNIYNQMTNDETLKAIPSSKEKLELYVDAVKVINYLSNKDCTRTKKFVMKRDLYESISLIANDLGEDYKEISIKAKKEEERYKKAIDCTKKYAQKRKIPIKDRDTIAYEEWLYK